MNQPTILTANQRPQSQRSVYSFLFVQWSTMQQYSTILFALTLMVTLNLSLLVWLLSQLNFELDNDSYLPLIGSVRVDGQLSVQRLASPIDSSELRVQSADLEMRPHQWSSSMAALALTSDSMLAKVGEMITVRSSHNDRLLMLIDHQTPASSKLFVDQVVMRSTPALQNRALSMKNGSAQVMQLQSVHNSTSSSLMLTSYTNHIRLRGTRHLTINSQNHSVRMNSRQVAIAIHSGHGRIMINTTRIQLNSQAIRTIVPTKLGRTYLTVGQLCLCENNGRLFMAPADQQHHYSQHSWIGHMNQLEQRCQRLAAVECWASQWTKST
ncbi:uncharacterized protein LOC124499062 [Dermatophagoides farinae]|nr:uncharacterized protein LOC124499062 [Dermatophagoides farinae]XP_046918873.1 uncharacterized protein LOC124499062 [Dermatophagoides farinae]